MVQLGKYAAEKGVAESEALGNGLKEKSAESVKKARKFTRRRSPVGLHHFRMPRQHEEENEN